MNNGIAFIGIIHIKAFPHVEGWVAWQKIAKGAIKMNDQTFTRRIVEFICY